MKLIRYELLLDGKSVGFMKPVFAFDLLSESSMNAFNRTLKVPLIKSRKENIKCYFTEKGITLFDPFLEEIKQNIKKHHLKFQLHILQKEVYTKDKRIAYQDEYQVVYMEKS